MIAFARHSLRLLLCLTIGLAIQLHAATAKDLEGEWVIDADATWASMKSSPQMAGMPPEQLKMMEGMVVAKMKEMSCVITADKIIQKMGGESKTKSFKVTKIEGDVLTTEETGDDGQTETNNIQVSGDTLNLTNPQQPGMTMVLKRKPAEAK